MAVPALQQLTEENEFLDKQYSYAKKEVGCGHRGGRGVWSMLYPEQSDFLLVKTNMPEGK